MEQIPNRQEFLEVIGRINRWLASNGLSLNEGLWVWSLAQVVIGVALFFVAKLAANWLSPPIEERLRQLSGRPRLLRALAVIFRRLHWIFFMLLLWAAVAIMREVTWPSRSYALSVLASLVTAWLIISVLSRIIRNRAVAKLVAVSAWSVAALSIFGVLDDTVVILETLSVTLGEVRISALLVIKSLVICSLLVWAALAASRLLDGQLASNEDLTPSVRVLVGKVVRIALLLIAVLTAFNVVGIDLTALAVFSGALGLGIGFGLQKIVSNLISGIILLLDKSIKPGDVIEIETVSGTTYGWVEHLGARYTSVRTRDGIDTLFPNETFIATPVTNWSHGHTRVRQKLDVGVSYDTDVERAIELCLEAASEKERILSYPEPKCLLIGFGDSSINLQLRYWLSDPQSGIRNIASEVYLSIWKKFREENIEIPFPQRDLHIRSAENIPVRLRPVGQNRDPDGASGDGD